MARAAHQCTSGRVSRHALWCDYSSRCVSAANGQGAQAVTKIGPPGEGGPDGSGKYQLLVIKPQSASMSGINQLRFGVPTSVWRVARRTVRTGKKVLPDGRLPVELLSQVHICLLCPHASASDPDAVILKGTFLSCVWGVQSQDSEARVSCSKSRVLTPRM